MLYLTDPDPRGSMGLGGKTVAGSGSGGNVLTAIDPKTGKMAWRHRIRRRRWRCGLLTTAGGLLFAGDGTGTSSRVRCEQRQSAVAYANREHLERAADLHAGWTSARARRGGDTLYSFTLY